MAPAPLVQTIECWCVTYAAKKGIKVPVGWNADDFKGNTTPHVGALAIFRYKNGVAHVAPITAITEKGFAIDQDGVNRCNNPSDFVLWDDKNIYGFWTPEATTSAVALLY